MVNKCHLCFRCKGTTFFWYIQKKSPFFNTNQRTTARKGRKMPTMVAKIRKIALLFLNICINAKKVVLLSAFLENKT